MNLYNHRKLEEAYTAFQAIRKRDPDDGVICGVLAYLESATKGNFEIAMELIEEALKLGCPRAFYHRILGDIYWKEGELKRAASEYERSIEDTPSLSNLIAYAEVLSLLESERATDIWQRVLNGDANNVRALVHLGRKAALCGDWTQGRSMLERAERQEAANPEVLFGLGYIYYAAKEYERAIDYLSRARENGYKNAGILAAMLAVCYRLTGHSADGIIFAKEALDLNPDDDYVIESVAGYKDEAAQLLESGRKREAYNVTKVALQMWPGDSKLLASMAGLEMELNQNYELGRQYMNQALEHSNTDLDFLYVIKGALWYDYLNAHNEGLACLEKAVSLNRSKFNLVALASRLIDTDYKRAHIFFEEAYKMDPDDPKTICGLAEVVLKGGDKSKGLELAARARLLAPDDAEINTDVGDLQLAAGELSEALNSYSAAEQSGYSQKHVIYMKMARCCRALGDIVRARDYAKKAVKIQPDYDLAKNLLAQLNSHGCDRQDG